MPAFHSSGSFATVKKGIRKTDGAVFAIKFIDKTALKKDDEAMLVSVLQSVWLCVFASVMIWAAAFQCVCTCL